MREEKRVKSQALFSRVLFRLVRNTLIIVAVLYGVLHLVLASPPIQKRVLEKLRAAINEYGIELDIESIEFSAFRPRIYLNHVFLRTNLRAPFQLQKPLGVDKIRIDFSLLGFLYGQVRVTDFVLFRPKLQVPRADALYREFRRLLEHHKPIAKPMGAFQLVVESIGTVDAFIDISMADPRVALRSDSLSAFLRNVHSDQKNLTVSSSGVELQWKESKNLISTLAIDIDLAPTSLRVNQGHLVGKDLLIDVKGLTSLPFRGIDNDSLSATFDIRIPLERLSAISDLKFPPMKGTIVSAGSVQRTQKNYSGNGHIRYHQLGISGYQFGNGETAFALSQEDLVFTKIRLLFAGATIESQAIKIRLTDQLPLEGEIAISGLQFDEFLMAVKANTRIVRMVTGGNAKISGNLRQPLNLSVDTSMSFKDFCVVEHDNSLCSGPERIVSASEGKVSAKLRFSDKKMDFSSNLFVLGGDFNAKGVVGFDGVARIQVTGTDVSLSQLKAISKLPIGGKAELACEIAVVGKDVKLSGSFDVRDGEIADLTLGTVKGQTLFQNNLLSFEQLEAHSLEPVLANGFVDFGPTPTRYRFVVDGSRVLIDDVLGIFKKKPLDFTIPHGGEAEIKIVIEGGHDGTDDVEVRTHGTGKDFEYYSERWQSGNFSFVYQPKAVELKRLTLLKRSGALAARGMFQKEKSQLELESAGIKLEELRYIGSAPLAGEINGTLHLEGDFSKIPTKGEGEVRFSKLQFRGRALADTTVKVQNIDNALEFVATVSGNAFRGTFTVPQKPNLPETLDITLAQFDTLPLIAFFFERDLPAIASIEASGHSRLTGYFKKWSDINGKLFFDSLNIGVRDEFIKNVEPIEVTIEKGEFVVNKLRLLGTNNEISGQVAYYPRKSVTVNLDGTLNLEYLQPFIPGLAGGQGNLSFSIRADGSSDKYSLLGNITMDKASFRITGLLDEFRNVKMRLTLSPDRINVEQFQSQSQDGTITVRGDILIDRFRAFVPRLSLIANRATIRPQEHLSGVVSGEFFIRGNQPPYLLGGKCHLLEGKLTKFEIPKKKADSTGVPALSFDIACDGNKKLMVATDIMDAEFKGTFHMIGNLNAIGLLGRAEVIEGNLLFRDTRFDMTVGNVKFEATDRIDPHFNISAHALVKEQKSVNPQEYEVNLLAFGTPDAPKIRLSSNPARSETEIISLLVLGVTTGSEGDNYLDLGTTIMGQIPFQSKLQSQLGVDIRMSTQKTRAPGVPGDKGISAGTGDTTVPTVRIQKDVTKKTKVSYSNTINTVPERELKVEHSLNENFSVNASARDRVRESTGNTTIQSYSVNIRYHFLFE